MENNQISNQFFSFYTLYSINDAENGNIDIYVTLEGKTYIATFFTLKNIISLMNKFKETGESNGKYFWASDMFIIERLDAKTIEECIHAILQDGTFKYVFSEIGV